MSIPTRFHTISAGALAAAMILFVLPQAAAAQMHGGPGGPGGWGERDRGWARRDWARRDWPVRHQASDEGRVTAEHFKVEGAEEFLGQGEIRVEVLQGSTPEARERLDYEAAMLDRLGAAGYDISGNGAGATQIAQIRIVSDVVEAAEQRRSPLSGEGDVSISNRGTAVGMAVALDFTEPKKALMATRMELRIVDSATGQALWEGRAAIRTRDQDDQWDASAIANRLAAAVLEDFPARGG